jgi:hypothetical protein
VSTKRDLATINNRRSRVPNLPVIIAVFMALLMGLMFLHQVSRSENFVNPIEILQGTPRAAADKLSTITQDDVTVYVPPDATTQPGTITIAAAQPDLMMVTDNTEWMLHKVANLEFQTPNGLFPDISFSQPLDICFSLTEQQWQEFSVQPGIYQVRHYMEEANPPYWEVLPQTTYPNQRQVCGQSYKLSAFALAIRVDTQVPVTGPTMMSNMVPTRTPIQAVPTRERRRDGASSESVLNPVPTNPPPTQPQATNPPPTDPPATPVPPTDPPPTEPPPTDPPATDPAPTDPPATEAPVLPGVELPSFPLP